MIAVLGLFLLVSTVVAGLVTIGHHGGLAVAGAVVTSLVVNVGLFVVAFRLLTPKQIPWRDMMPGAILGAVGWTLLQYLGGLLVEHSLRNTSQEYGAFALVLGLIAFLFLAAQVTLYAAEVNVVLARRLWPRSLVQPPLTVADKKVLSSIALEGKRRPEQFVTTGFTVENSANATEILTTRPDEGGARPPVSLPRRWVSLKRRLVARGGCGMAQTHGGRVIGSASVG